MITTAADLREGDSILHPFDRERLTVRSVVVTGGWARVNYRAEGAFLTQSLIVRPAAPIVKTN